MDNLLKRMGIHMAHFNKGIFHGVKFSAKPKEVFRNILGISGWYGFYSPGDNIIFSISLKELNGRGGGFVIKRYEDGKNPQHIIAMSYSSNEESRDFIIPSLPGHCLIEYRMEELYDSKEYTTLMSIKATYNDSWAFPILSSLITFILTILAGAILGVIEFDKLWHVINPFWNK